MYSVPLSQLPFHSHLNFALALFAESEIHQIYREMNTGHWWWDEQNQCPAEATVVPVICASEETQLITCLGDQHV